jgi:hypothetical protein
LFINKVVIFYYTQVCDEINDAPSLLTVDVGIPLETHSKENTPPDVALVDLLGNKLFEVLLTSIIYQVIQAASALTDDNNLLHMCRMHYPCVKQV